ncbi:hypothetical protein L6452_13810 [Arctium lappa]|uniref:Uncharacterized protein n=1 Tax=Arctium lappa TaxID=4217 RepID=A0ACB9CJK3_ARCLA|nr:hypothetical protein L6452_13810 [Arctium lappa]
MTSRVCKSAGEVWAQLWSDVSILAMDKDERKMVIIQQHFGILVAVSSEPPSVNVIQSEFPRLIADEPIVEVSSSAPEPFIVEVSKIAPQLLWFWSNVYQLLYASREIHHLEERT